MESSHGSHNFHTQESQAVAQLLHAEVTWGHTTVTHMSHWQSHNCNIDRSQGSHHCNTHESQAVAQLLHGEVTGGHTVGGK